MTAGAIIIIAFAASGVLMMRFRKRWLAKINIAFTNRITSLFAGWLPGFGILTHVGRKSGKFYRTPVNVFRAPNGFIIGLTLQTLECHAVATREHVLHPFRLAAVMPSRRNYFSGSIHKQGRHSDCHANECRLGTTGLKFVCASYLEFLYSP